jgi:hypothetical protein
MIPVCRRSAAMKKLSIAAAFAALAVLGSCSGPKKGPEGVIVGEKNGIVTIRNSRFSVDYDLAKGEYSARSVVGGPEALSGARIMIDGFSSGDPGVRHAWTSAPVEDPLGRGRILQITVTRDRGPSLLLNISLYEDKEFAAFRAGIDNTTDAPLTVHEIQPMAGAEAFGSIRPKPGLRLLNGVGGAGESRVTKGPAMESPNNLLLTFADGGAVRSVVVGGLVYKDFAKFARYGKSRSGEGRLAELMSRAPVGTRLVGYLDCGADRAGEFRSTARMRQFVGSPYTFPGSEAAAPSRFGDVLFDSNEVIIQISELDPKKTYLAGFSWWDYDANGRVETVEVWDKNAGKRHVLVGRELLPDFRKSGKSPEERALKIPAEAYASGTMHFGFKKISGPADAVVSEVWIWEAAQAGPVPEAWGPFPAAEAAAPSGPSEEIGISAYDPVGRLVEPRSLYLPEDAFYVDFTTANPFEALEKYGLAVSAAMKTRPNVYDFPSVCAWYVSIPEYGGDADMNNTPGVVAEMEKAVRTGFLRYSPVAIRLVPDTYEDNNEQGWWDDAHWRKFGHYLPPYETSAKWGQAITDRGGVPITYFQTGFLSLDYAREHPDHMLGNDISRAAGPDGHRTRACSYDYTDPGFSSHMREAWANLRAAGIKGVMFDYPESAWREDGRFEDKFATTASAYRRVFDLAKTGLGPDSYIDERNVEGNPYHDVTIGVVDSQRVWGDSDLALPEMYAKCGLRWYKTRVVYTYDMDAKNFAKVRPANRDGLRQMLTMVYMTAGRVLLATSFGRMTPDQVHDLSRIFPIHKTPRSPRPLDAFTGGAIPRIYDLPVDAGWHQVAFFNPDPERGASVGVDLDEDSSAGGLGLAANGRYHVYDFWNDAYLGLLDGTARLEQALRPGEVRMMSVRLAQDHPQFLSTSRHVMQGYPDLVEAAWDGESMTLRGKAKIAAGEPTEIAIAGNGYAPVSASAAGALKWLEPEAGGDKPFKLTLVADRTGFVEWSVAFKRGR